MRLCAIIPARGGSQRIPRKNIRPFHGRPILEYSIELAKACRLFDKIVVTTDDAEIATIARSAGADVHMRPSDDGTKGTQEVAADVVRDIDHIGLVCVLYATTPLLTMLDLWAGYQALSMAPVFTYGVSPDTMEHAGYYWGPAAAFGVVPLDAYGCPIAVPANRAIDINTEADWLRAESMYDALRRAS